MRKPIKLTPTSSSIPIKFKTETVLRPDNQITSQGNELLIAEDKGTSNTQIDINPTSSQLVASFRSGATNNSSAFGTLESQLTPSFDESEIINTSAPIQKLETSLDLDFGDVVIEGGGGGTPDWAQTNPSDPGYIKNKDIAERYRPILINGKEFLSHDRESGPLNIVGLDGILVSHKDGALCISGDPNTENSSCCENVNKIYYQEYLKNENGDYVLDENGQKIPVGNPSGLLVDEIKRATIAENEINDKIAALFSVEKTEEGTKLYKGEIVEYISDSISITLPIATVDRLGAVKSSISTNKVSVDIRTGEMEVNNISTDKLVQGEKDLILNGGDTDLIII